MKSKENGEPSFSFFILGAISPESLTRAAGLLLIFLSTISVAHAQRTWFDVTIRDTTVFVDFLVIPDSLVVIGAIEWRFDAPTGRLWMRVDPPAEVYVSYRRWPIDLPVPPSRTRGDYRAPPISMRPRTDSAPRTDLTTSGSFTRGVQIGTDRDLSLESGLQFQASGMITDNIRLMASLTDRSTPIQPDGTTQTLREFDQVLVRLTHPNGSLEMGDVDVSLSQGRFSRLTRRLQGATATARTTAGTYSVAAAVMRGTFKTVTLPASDGIQGPYRLTGGADEPFVMVLAGTERVYLNGMLLERGEDRDYVIDYGLGEVTFTNRRLIRADHRIVVEYQYLSTTYARSLIAAEATSPAIWDGRLTLGFSYIREADDTRSDATSPLSEQERDVLRAAGDDASLARIAGADSLGFRLDADIALYVKRDTLFAGTTYTIFEHRPGDPSGAYRVSFSNVGPGAGSYRIAPSLANAVVYRWVGPGQGEYEPFRTLIAPREQQLLSTRMALKLSETATFESEWMMSALDKNRFSNRDDDDNLDTGWRAALALSGRLSGTLEHRSIGRNVVFFDRVRDVDFDRRWNVPLTASGQETLNEADLAFQVSEFTRMRAVGGRLSRGAFESARAGFGLQSTEPGWPELTTDADWATSDLGRFGTWHGEALYRAALTPVLRWDAEMREADLDTRHAELTPGVLLVPATWLSAGLFRSTRTDHRRDVGRYQRNAQATTWEAELKLDPKRWVRSENRIVLRNRSFATDPASGVLDETSRGVAFRSETDIRSPGRRVELRLLHAVSTESRSLLDETYVDVGPELGQFVWIDLNNDGVKQLDEFFPETTPNEGTYVRQFRPSDEVFPLVSLETRVQWGIDPQILGARYTGSLDVREQNRTDTPSDILLFRPSAFLNDSTTVNGRIRLLQELDLFRNRADVSFKLTADVSRGLLRQFLGLERSIQQRFSVNSEYRFERVALVGIEIERAQNTITQEEAAFRNRDIRGWMLAPYVRFWPVTDVQGHVRLTYQSKRDEAPLSPVEARIWRVRTETNARLGARWNLFTAVEVRSADLSGTASPLSEFELTDGAGTGRSVYWTLNVNAVTSESVRAALQYDGRTRQSGAPIQTMRLTMTAAF